MSSTLRIFVSGLLLLTAMLLGLFIFQMARPKDTVVQAGEIPQPLSNSYLVAARPLPGGTLVRDTDFVTKLVPSKDMPNDAILDTPEARTSLRGALIRDFVDTGHPISTVDVLRPRDRGFIASVLREGDRAVAIGVDPISGVAGLIWPGDHVDVLLTQGRDSAPTTQRALTSIVLADVRVIAIDQEMVQGASNDNTTAGKLVRTVTVEVGPEQAQRIAAASQMGKLSLAIRSAASQTVGNIPLPISSADIVPEPPEKARGWSVTVIQGSNTSLVTSTNGFTHRETEDKK